MVCPSGAIRAVKMEIPGNFSRSALRVAAISRFLRRSAT
jgi:hypothetical protein